MRTSKFTYALLAGAVVLTACGEQSSSPLTPNASALLASQGGQPSVINVLLNTRATDAILADLGTYGRVTDRLDDIDAVFVTASAAQLDAIRARPYVAAAEMNQKRSAGPVSTAAAKEPPALSMWNLDAINVTEVGLGKRAVREDGEGVYVAVLDAGLGANWQAYFPAERIAAEYGMSFSGSPEWGGGVVAGTPNKWGLATEWHGTHVTSTIIGFNLNGTMIAGVAPKAKIIPVKVLYDPGFGWSSIIAAGITYVANLRADRDFKPGPLAKSPVVINMSLGGPVLDPVEAAAIKYALARGVLIVAAAGNEGNLGMSYPGALKEVISVGSAGWGDCDLKAKKCFGQWTSAQWFISDVPETWADAYASQFYISDFSSRQKKGQDLDVIAPGDWVVGPYQLNASVHTSYFYLSGTSMASPHVAGIVALMAQRAGSLGLKQEQVEAWLEKAAMANAFAAKGLYHPLQPSGAVAEMGWLEDAIGHGFITADKALALVGKMVVAAP
jgi:subtilisin family serine protease